MTIGGSVRFANVTGPLYKAKKEFRMSFSLALFRNEFF